MLRLSLLLFGCAQTPSTPIVFHEVTDDRVPMVAQTMLAPDGFTSGLGAAVGDVDGDGRPDVYLAGGGLYFNRADARGFRLEKSGFADPAATGASFADWDNDGDLDLALAVRGGVRLYTNDGSGNFTAAASLGDAGDVTLGLAFGDLDGDGWLDLVAGNYGFPTDPMRDAQPSRIFLNQRDGSFSELTQPLSDPDKFVRAMIAVIADFDQDGRLDIFLGDDSDVPFFVRPKPRHDLVLLNRGLDTTGLPMFTDASAEFGLDSPRATMGLALANGGADLFITDVRAGWLFRSTGSAFQDVTRASGIDLSGPSGEQWWQWGCVFTDLDGDGGEDLLVGQSPIHLNYMGTEKNGPLLLRNRGARFELVRYAFGGPMFIRSTVLIDLDGDGDDDVIGAPFFDHFRFFINDTAPRKYLRFSGATPGTVVTVESGGVTQKRMAYSGGQPYSQSEARLDFAVRGAAQVTVKWPGGATQSFPATPNTTMQLHQRRRRRSRNPTRRTCRRACRRS